MISFTIPIAPVTKKNSSRVYSGQGRTVVLPSKAYENYQGDAGYFMPNISEITSPINVKALYYMKTRRKVDLNNLHNALHDVLVYYGIVADDSAIGPAIIVSTDGSRVLVDKENPRTEVTITPSDER